MKKFEFNVREDTRPSAKNAGLPYGFGPQPFEVTYTPIRSGVFNIYLFGEIESAEQFMYGLEAMSAAGEQDTVVIHLSTNGGSLDATDTFIMGMQDCAAKIIVRASGGVHSAGSLILLRADEFYLSEDFNCLIHNGSAGAGGKFSDFKAQAKHAQEYMEKVMRRNYEGFLTDKEIQELLDGKDFWLDGGAFGKRYEARNAMLAERAEKAQQEMLEAMGLGEKKPKRKRKPKVENQVVKVAE